MKKYTYSATNADNQNKWWVVDADGAVLGRLASKVAAAPARQKQPAFYPPCRPR